MLRLSSTNCYPGGIQQAQAASGMTIKHVNILPSLNVMKFSDGGGQWSFFPFEIDGKQFSCLHQEYGCLPQENLVIALPAIENVETDGFYLRLSKCFTKGFCNLTHFSDQQGCEFVGTCHDFAYYLVFGFNVGLSAAFGNDFVMSHMPDYEILPFDSASIIPKDILQLGEKECFKKVGENGPIQKVRNFVRHSAVYVGEGKYINKIGENDIYFQDYNGICNTYPAHHREFARIIRRRG